MRLKETASNEVRKRLLQRLEQLFCQDAYRIVELHYAQQRRRAYFSIILFHPEGVSLEACSELHKIADVEIERLQAAGLVISDNGDYRLELSSPGLGRRLQSRREFEIFSGQPVRCLVDGNWFHGTLLALQADDRGSEQVQLHQSDRKLPDKKLSDKKLAGEFTDIDISGQYSFRLEQVVKVELDS